VIAREALWAMSNEELARQLAAGFPLDEAALVGSYRGVSLGLPRIVERLTWTTFRKSFHRGEDGRVRGHNVRLEQRGRTGPAIAQRRAGREITFGPFVVRAPDLDGGPFGCTTGVLLDYGGANPAFSPLARLRDPLVAVNEGSTALLLGASYLAIGRRGVRTPSFFTLERED
jgi:hypothetical protein